MATVKSKKKQKTHTDEMPYGNWTVLTVNIAPGVLKDAILFSKKNDLYLSQLVNSAVKVFLVEAEQYIKDQNRLKGSFFGNKTETFRVGASYTTEDVCKEQRLNNPIDKKAKEQVDTNEKILRSKWRGENDIK